MSQELIVQLIIGIVPAIFAGIVSYIVSLKKCKSEIKTMDISNKHEIDKLMKQHEIDIEALKEKQKLDLEKLEKEHELKMKEIKLQSEQEILKKEKELSNSAMYSTMQGSLESVMGNIFSSSEVQNEISKQVKESLKNKKA